MKKKEVFLVVILILFGIIYHFYEKGEVNIFNGCSRNSRTLLDKNHPISFSDNEYHYENIKMIKLKNVAGGILVEPSDSESITVNPTITIFHKNKTQANKIRDEIKVLCKAIKKDLKITVESKNRFPYKRVRIYFKLNVPKNVELILNNNYGNVEINKTGKNIKLDASYGDISLMGVSSNLEIYHKHGNISLHDIEGNIGIKTRYSKVDINKAQSLQLESNHSSINLNNIENETNILQASHGKVIAENCQRMKMNCRHTKIILKKINREIDIRNSHSSIHLNDIKSDINVRARHCYIRMSNIISNDLIVKNSYDNVNIENISTRNSNIFLNNGNLNITFKEIKEQLNINNKYSKIYLKFPRTIKPSYNIILKYGKVINETDVELNILKDKYQQYISSLEGSPAIIIKNSYGDVRLQHVKFPDI